LVPLVNHCVDHSLAGLLEFNAYAFPGCHIPEMLISYPERVSWLPQSHFDLNQPVSIKVKFDARF
jgi:hypothetical protein